MAGLAIRYEDKNQSDSDQENTIANRKPSPDEDVKIIWKGKKIAKVVFASGKEVVFEE